jgi:hypothetical protein
LSGCATAQGFRDLMDSWIDNPVGDLVQAFGPPQSQYTLPDGSRILSFTQSSTRHMGGNTTTTPVTTSGIVYGAGGPTSFSATTYQTTTSPSYTVSRSCTVNFKIDSRGMVRSWQATGDMCVARP